MSAVDISNISCSIGSSQVLVQASLRINHGSIYCLLGPSVRNFETNFINNYATDSIFYRFYFKMSSASRHSFIKMSRLGHFIQSWGPHYLSKNDSADPDSYETIILFTYQGCGKTTICLSILKLNRLSEGKIILFKDQKDISIPGKDVGTCLSIFLLIFFVH